jgi:hypothetical protein
MEKKRIVLLISDQIEQWAEDNDISMSMMDMIEVAERIFNILPQILGEQNDND